MKHYAYTAAGTAAYKKDKAAKSGKPQKAGPISEDEKERAMGAYDYVKNKYPDFKIDPKEHKTLKDAQMGLADVVSESDIADKYPEPVWVKASNKLVAQMWAMYKKKMTQSKGPKKMHRMPNGKMMSGASHGK